MLEEVGTYPAGNGEVQETYGNRKSRQWRLKKDSKKELLLRRALIYCAGEN
jgi:hypothetical protein